MTARTPLDGTGLAVGIHASRVLLGKPTHLSWLGWFGVALLDKGEAI